MAAAKPPPRRFRRLPPLLAALLGGLGLFLAGCDQPAAPATLPDPLRVGVLPDQTPANLQANYLPLVRYLGETLSVRAELVIPDSYEDLGERFHRGELDLASFGGVTFAQAERRDGAVPLAMRLIDLHFSSVVIARAGLEGKFPDDFRGRSFAFGPVSSTSANHMPRHFFGLAGWDPEKLFGSVTHLANHDAVITAVGEGRVDLGVVNGQVFRRRLADGSVEPRRFREVWESPHYTDNVWAVPAGMPGEMSSRLRLAFLILDARNPAHRELMTPLGVRAFMPATRADFNLVRERVTGSATYAPP